MTTRFLTPATVAARTGVDTRTIRRALAQGRIQGAHRTPGGHWRIPASAVAGWLRTVREEADRAAA